MACAGQRARAEPLMGRWKKVIEPTLKVQTIENQRTEVEIGITVLNKMTVLGRPAFRAHFIVPRVMG